jgi:hypothetical protein
MKTPTKAQEAKLAELSNKIATAQNDLVEKMKSLPYVDPADAKEPGKMSSDPKHSFKAWRTAMAKDSKGLPKELIPLVKAAKLDAAGEAKLREHYLQNVCADTKPTFDPITKQLAAMTKERDAVNGAIPGSFIFKDMAKPRESFVMMRGQYTKPGEKVEPNTPSFLPPLAKANPKAHASRLDLANWLVEPANPMTARVAVNRYWQQFFGTGIVKSSGDFGAQGDMPSHPELLDYLAISFRENKWDVKALVKQMLTSQTFRQSSKVTADLYKRDPENRLYARGPRFRLDAEQIRDNALFVSGLMVFDMGGRGVRPYQPPRVWEPVAFSGSNTGNYVQDKGAGLYRRSLYTFIKRTAPHPYMSNFDAPNRESSCSRRERSNTPLQALQLMNDVQHFEAARKFAERLMIEGGKTPADRIRFGYRVVLARQPEAVELEIVEKTLTHYLQRYEKDLEAAKKVVRVGESPLRPGLAEPELAAYTLIANLLLNLDETVMRN